MQDQFRLYGWLIPIACTLTSGWMIYREQAELSQTNVLRESARIEAQNAIQEKQTIDSLPIEKHYATVADSPSEEYDFVTYLKSVAASYHLSVRNWTNDQSELGSSIKGQSNAPISKDIKKLNTVISIAGPYENLRSLMSTLEDSDRLLALSNLNWSKNTEGAALTFTVSRFVVTHSSSDAKPALKLTSN